MNPSEASVVRKASFDKPPHSASAMSDADDSRVLIAFEHIPMQSYCSFCNSHHVDVPRPLHYTPHEWTARSRASMTYDLEPPLPRTATPKDYHRVHFDPSALPDKRIVGLLACQRES